MVNLETINIDRLQSVLNALDRMTSTDFVGSLSYANVVEARALLRVVLQELSTEDK